MIDKNQKKDIKNITKLSIVAIIVLIFCGLIFGEIYFNALKSISINSVKITKISGFSNMRLDIETTIEIENPSGFEFNAKYVDYEIEFYTYNKKGRINNINIQPHSIKNITISEEVTNELTAEIINTIISKNNGDLSIKGNVVFMESPIFIKFPFEKKINIKTEMINYVYESAKKITGDFLNNTIKTLTDIFS